MAKLYTHKNSLEKQIEKLEYPINGKIVLFFILITIFWLPVGIISFIAYIKLCDNEIKEYYKQRKIYEAGLKGEKKAIKDLSELDDSFYIFTDIEVPKTNDVSSGQLDVVIVGNKGVDIIEVKNINGTITGDIEDAELTIVKENIEKELYNPYKQVKTHSYKLANYLKSNNINTWINGYVYVNKPENGVNPLNISNCEGKIFADKDELLNAIINKESNNISSFEKDKAIEILKNLINNK